MDTSAQYNFNTYDSANRDTDYSYSDYNDTQEREEDDYNRYDREEEEEAEEEKPSSNNIGKIVAIVLLTLLLAASIAANYYLWEENEGAADVQNKLKKEIDALAVVKAQIEKELAEAKTTASSYKAESDNAQHMLNESNERISRLERKNARLAREKAGMKDYKIQLAEAKKVNVTLQAQIKSLADELSYVKAENRSLKDSIVALRNDQRVLKDKIGSAAGLLATSIKLEAMSRRKKEKYELTDKAKRTNRLAISFELAENKLAAEGLHNLHVIIYSPAGEILGDSTSKFTIQPEGKESTFTRNKEVNYPAEGGKIFFNWDDTGSYAKGTYKMEVYCDGKLTGQTQIDLK